MASRVYPSENKLCRNQDQDRKKPREPRTLTVWKRSSLSFQGTSGFTVFDRHGRLVFRVDNYSRHTSGRLLLMDGAGTALLSFKPQVLSMQCQWNAYREEEDEEDGCYGESGRRSKVFSMRRGSSSAFFGAGGKEDIAAEVFMGPGSSSSGRKLGGAAETAMPGFTIEGSFRSRNCKIKNAEGELVAMISRKKAMNSTVVLSDDVFSLVIQPGYSSELVMGFVLVLDRISSKHYTPFLCSY